jgi:peptidoglycan/LPS O-acetylase OafA/YrhL
MTRVGSPGRRAPRLESVLPGRDNNLNAIRMMAATAVLVSHAFPITGAREPLEALTGTTGGELAVAVFFGISGLLIARSFDRRRSMTQFTLARVLRLFPALVVVLALTVAAGAWFTRLPLTDYLAQPATWSYIPVNLLLYNPQFALPGVFETNPFGPIINGSLWTLFYEVACYGGVVVLGLSGILRGRWWALMVLLAVIFSHLALNLAGAPSGVAEGRLPLRIILLAELAFPFMLGTCAYVWRAHLPLSGWTTLALWLPVPLLPPGEAMTAWLVAALVYTALWLGFVPQGPLLAYNRLGDYSYGIYLYAFPVQQALAAQVPGMTPITNIAMALPITLLLGIASWQLVERYALSALRATSNAAPPPRPQASI